MVLTVTGSSGSITWCDQTWNLDSGDSGDKKEVCPTSYVTPFYSGGTNFGHTWKFIPTGTPGANSELYLRRGNFFNTSKNRLVFNDYDIFGGAYKFDDRPTFGTFGTLGVLVSTSPVAVYNDYKILDTFFGSYTNGGITYAWERGTNWPTP